MNYLIVGQTAGKYYLMLAKDNGIQAYKSKEEVMLSFEGYTQAWTRNYESSISAVIGMIEMNPVAIEAPENVADLLPFIIDKSMKQISGGAIGRGYTGIEVSKEILKLKQFEIWDESMRLAGIKK
jgi:hypothetical protein